MLPVGEWAGLPIVKILKLWKLYTQKLCTFYLGTTYTICNFFTIFTVFNHGYPAYFLTLLKVTQPKFQQLAHHRHYISNFITINKRLTIYQCTPFSQFSPGYQANFLTTSEANRTFFVLKILEISQVYLARLNIPHFLLSNFDYTNSSHKSLHI